MITDGRRGTFNKVCQSLHVPGALTYPWESVIQEHRGVEDKKDFVNDKKDCNCVNAFNKNSPNTLKAKRKQSPKASACRTLLKAELHISVNDAGEKLCRLQKNKWITLKQCPSTEKLACDNQNFQSSLFVMTETRKSDKQCELQPVCFLFFSFFFTYASRPPLALLAPPHCPLFIRPITAGRSTADRLCITVSRGRFIK